MALMLLVVTIACGVLGNIFVKLSNGFARGVPTLLVFVFYGLCTYLLTLTVQYFEVGVVYAVWSGVGIAATALIGIIWFGESTSRIKVLSIGLIILGAVLLQAATPGA